MFRIPHLTGAGFILSEKDNLPSVPLDMLAIMAIQISGAARLIDTSDAAAGVTIQAGHDHLPLRRRTFSSEALLTPQVTDVAYGDAGRKNRSSSMKCCEPLRDCMFSAAEEKDATIDPHCGSPNPTLKRGITIIRLPQSRFLALQSQPAHRDRTALEAREREFLQS